MIHIVLLEPEIPQNTGNISRTCAVTGAHLHLIGPMGFSIEDRWLKRAGLDYWDQLEVFTYDSWADFKQKHPDARPWMASSKAAHSYCEAPYEQGDVWLLFGKETKGLPEDLLAENQSACVRLPMIADARSLNLSNTVAVAVYEALRQLEFPQLLDHGKMWNDRSL